MAASDLARNAVWQGLLDVARTTLYYQKLGDKYKRIHFWFRFVLLVSATGNVASVLNIFPDESRSVVAVVSTTILGMAIAWELISDYPRKIAILVSISRDCRLLETEWRNLWIAANMDGEVDTNILQSNNKLQKAFHDVTSRIDETDIRDNEALNKKCAKDAYEIIKFRDNLQLTKETREDEKKSEPNQ